MKIAYDNLIEELKEPRFKEDSSSDSSSSSDSADLFDVIEPERQRVKTITLARASKMSHQ